jgi:hypothetical protein
LNLAVIACSKGAEVYSILSAIRSARPDLQVNVQAMDISSEIVEFAQRGIYSRDVPTGGSNGNGAPDSEDATWRDQPISIFERMTDREVEALFELDGNKASVRASLKEESPGLLAMRMIPGFPAFLDLRILSSQTGFCVICRHRRRKNASVTLLDWLTRADIYLSRGSIWTFGQKLRVISAGNLFRICCRKCTKAT